MKSAYLSRSSDLVIVQRARASTETVVIADGLELSPANAKGIAQKILTDEQLATSGNSTRIARYAAPSAGKRLEGNGAEASAS